MYISLQIYSSLLPFAPSTVNNSAGIPSLPSAFHLTRVSMPMHAEHDIVMADLFVRLSVTRWYYIKTNAHVKLFPPSVRGMTLS